MNEEFDEKSELALSRRSLLSGAGRMAVGAAGLAVVSTGGLGLIAGCGEEEKAAEQEEASPLPWPYKKLDTKQVAEIAHEKWYEGFCTFAVISAIINPLCDKVGEPYTTLPLEAFIFGHGGTVGWGTICGTLTGAGIATSLVCGAGVGKTGEEAVNEVINWYTKTELPVYKPEKPKANVAVQSRSDSPLCHISVGKWMTKADRGFWSPERKERCAQLAADVAIRTVELLNDFADGKFKAENVIPVKTYNITAQHNCTECHGDNVPNVPLAGNQT